VFSFLSCLSHPFCHLPHPLFSHLVLLSSRPFRLYTSPSLDTVSHYNSTPSNASQRSVRFTTCIFGTYPSNQRYTISDSPELADLINTEYQIIGITRCGFVVVVMCKGLPPCCVATEARGLRTRIEMSVRHRKNSILSFRQTSFITLRVFHSLEQIRDFLMPLSQREFVWCLAVVVQHTCFRMPPCQRLTGENPFHLQRCPYGTGQVTR